MSSGADEVAPLIVSVSGIRGIVGASLTPQVVTDFAACYGTNLAGREVVVSRDGRSSGLMYSHAAVAGLLSVGCNVVDIGIAATPTCGYVVKQRGAGGAIQITASHNPPEWNGLKLFRPQGFVLGPTEGRRIADAYQVRQYAPVAWDKIGICQTMPRPHEKHLERVCSLVNVDAIRGAGFHVVLDANHGSGAVFGPDLLSALGCRFEVLGGTPDGLFEHGPEPTQANLLGLCAAVKDRGADFGFAVDPDADRLAIVDNRGTYIGEEYTLALAIRHRAASAAGPVVINSSTSRVSEDVARSAGCPVLRTPVGEVHVAERMLTDHAIIGGEGNGGVIDPRVGLGRDSAVSMALILDLLAAAGTSLTEVMRSMPVYHICKEKFPVQRARIKAIIDSVETHFRDGQVDTSDGIRIDWPDAWVQVRPSNTEPIIRVIAEAITAEHAKRLCAEIGRLL